MKTRATIEDLRAVDGKAEIVDGELVRVSPTGGKPGRAGGKIYIGLERYERETQRGCAFPDCAFPDCAFPDNVGFLVKLPDRESFSPDAAFYTGTEIGEDFLEGVPVFAVEVRSKGDYGSAFEERLARKIADYFAAGTSVVWDVDLLRERVVRVHRATDPSRPTAYRPGDVAEAEPALPGWKMPVDEIFS